MNNEKNEGTENQSQLPSGVRITIAMGTLLSILIAFNQCTFDKKPGTARKLATNSSAPSTVTTDAGDIITDNELPDGLVMPPMNSPTPESELDEIDVGVKSFEQIFYSMAELTGVPPSTTSVQNVYREVSVQLPANNSVKSFLPSNQVAIVKLAAEFCEVLVENGTLRAVIWPTINFGLIPTQVFTPTNKQLIINQTIDRFIPPLDSQTRVITYNELAKLFDELLLGENLTTSVTTRKVVKGMCISSMASAHSTLF